MKTKKQAIYFYTTGFLVGVILFTLIILSFFEIQLKKEVKNFTSTIQYKILGQNHFLKNQEQTLRHTPSKSIIKEISKYGGHFENTKKLTNTVVGFHSSFAIEKDEKTNYKLKPNISIQAHFLLSNKKNNLDPPVLFLNNNVEYSDELTNYLKSESVLKYKIESNAQGLRKTYPKVISDKKILIVGDSVAFGHGVADQHTFPSALQGLVKNDYQVLNGALSGYDTKENLAIVEKFKSRELDHLIYIICANDLKTEDTQTKIQEIKKIVQRLKNYQLHYNKITIILHNYIYESLVHYLSPNDVEHYKKNHQLINHFFKDMEKLTKLNFINWLDISNQYREQQQSVFSTFALYVDHCHLSKKGNTLLANAVYNKLTSLKKH